MSSRRCTQHSIIHNEVYFRLAINNSRIGLDKYRTVVEKNIKTTKYNAKKENDYVGMVKFVVSWVFC